MDIYDLTPQYSSQKSFGGKAKVIVDDDGTKILVSYNTKVAKITPSGELKVMGYFTPTTAKHINEFAQQNGFPKMTKAQMDSPTMHGFSIKKLIKGKKQRSGKISVKKTIGKKPAKISVKKMVY